MKKRKKNNVNLKIWYYVGASIIAVICIAIIVVQLVRNNTTSTDGPDYYDLESCTSYYARTDYDMQISCYKRYGGSDMNDRITDLEIEKRKANGESTTSTDEPTNQSEPTPNVPTGDTGGYSAPSQSSQYQPTEQPTYTPSAPEPAPAPAPAPSCDDYRNKYYSEYQAKVAQTQTSYNSQISSASMQCSGHGGCPAVTSLKRQLESELAALESEYNSNMTSVGCTP